jgi:hypothetical protein
MGPELEEPPPLPRKRKGHNEDSLPSSRPSAKKPRPQAVEAPVVEPGVSNVCQPSERKRTRPDNDLPALKRAMLRKEEQRSS